MNRLFLFDFDGVVVDSLDLYESAVNLCLKKIGAEPIRNRTDFLALFEENFYEGIEKKGVDIKAFTAASACIAPTLNYELVRPHNSLLPVLIELKKGHRLSIVSSNSSFAIRLIFKDIDSYFEHIFGYEFMFSKIDKIAHAMDLFGIRKESTYYVGDTTGDIREAKMAGVHTVAVTWGWHSRERLKRACPDYLIDSPCDLLKLNSKAISSRT
ncbi:MAG: HAD family hydrolase [Syntrophales bacterium]